MNGLHTSSIPPSAYGNSELFWLISEPFADGLFEAHKLLCLTSRVEFSREPEAV